MTEQGSTGPAPTPLPQGGQTQAGDLPSGRHEIFSSPASPKGTHISEGPVFVDGTLPKRRGTSRFDIGSLPECDRIRIGGFITIGDADLSDDQTWLAQILWIIRGMSSSPGIKPIGEWTLEEIIEFARGSAPGESR